MRERAVQIVEDHPVIRFAVTMALPRSHYFVSAHAESVSDALDQSRTCPIDLVILDLNLPDQSGEYLIPHFRKARPQTPILVYSATSNLHIPHRCMEAGARGFVRKSSPVEELVGAINRIASGRHRYIPECLEQLPRNHTHGENRLTVREQETARLIALGKSSREIAGILRISERTVNIHRSNMMRKIGAHKSSDVAIYAISTNLVSTDEVSSSTRLCSPHLGAPLGSN